MISICDPMIPLIWQKTLVITSYCLYCMFIHFNQQCMEEATQNLHRGDYAQTSCQDTFVSMEENYNPMLYGRTVKLEEPSAP